LFGVEKAPNVLPPDERQVLAKLLPVELEKHIAVMDFLLGHLVEHLGGRGEFRAQALGKSTVDAAILLLVGDGQRQHLLLAQLGKSFHGALWLALIGSKLY